MADFDINNPDFNNIGNWPIAIRIVVILLLCGALLGAGFYFDTQKQLERLDKEKLKETQLREEFKKKQLKANALPKLKQQLAEIKISFGTLLKRLPSQTEVDKVLVDISQTGLANGLTFELFKPGNKVAKEFYGEQPISLKMIGGNYHALGKFVSDLASLERIVTQHNITISPNKQNTELTMESTVNTYHYLESEESNAEGGTKK